MQTTIDLPLGLHKQVMALARDTSRSFSQTVCDLVRRGLQPSQPREIARSATTGLPLVRLGRVITTEAGKAV